MSRSAFRTKAAMLVTASAVLATWVTLAFAWGITAHQIVTFEAIAILPQPLAGFFSANLENIVAFSNEPDLLATSDPDEGPNHFLDLDAFDKPPFASVPSDEAEFLRLYGEKAAGKGRLPWAVKERYAALVKAFRDRQPQAVVKEAGYLSHYLADATMPLHATVNYKGQFSGNVIFDDDSVHRHVHVRFEIGMIDAHRNEIAEAVKRRGVATYAVGDPAAETLAILRESYGFIDPILAADRELLPAGGEATPEYYDALYKAVGNVAAERLVKAKKVVASFWLSAWQEAGSPNLLPAEVVLSSPPLETARPLHEDYPRPGEDPK